MLTAKQAPTKRNEVKLRRFKACFAVNKSPSLCLGNLCCRPETGESGFSSSGESDPPNECGHPRSSTGDGDPDGDHRPGTCEDGACGDSASCTYYTAK
jgi:hypothetical protein